MDEDGSKNFDIIDRHKEITWPMILNSAALILAFDREAQVSNVLLGLRAALLSGFKQW